MNERFFLGVDGGNTKTVALIVDPLGNVRGHGQSACSDIYGAASSDAALQELDLAIGVALRGAGIGVGEVGAATFSLAGADWPEDFDFLRRALEKRGFVRNVSIYNDAFAPLRAGSYDFTGVAVVCGTGAAVGARSQEGKLWNASWWLDVQGARQLGQRALHAVMHAELGLGPPTGMTDGVLRAYGSLSVEELLHGLTRRVEGRWLTEPAARVLVAQAEAGDEVASRIASDHGLRLGQYSLVAARQAELRSFHRLVLAGPVLRNSSVIAGSLVDCVREGHPGVEVVMPDLEPAVGAVLLCFDRLGISVSGDVMARLRAAQSG